MLALAPGGPKGDLKGAAAVGSVGEVVAVEEPERWEPTAGSGRWPRVRCSDLVDDIIDYPVHRKLSNLADEMADGR